MTSIKEIRASLGSAMDYVRAKAEAAEVQATLAEYARQAASAKAEIDARIEAMD